MATVSTTGPYYVKYKQWWDTKHFKQAGDFWLRDGAYCPFPEGTDSYDEYWDEQEHYIKNGYTHEGQFIDGLYYLYLNYCPIKHKQKKGLFMPDFWSMDADYFEHISVAMGLRPDPDPFRPVVLEIAKTRQCGASFKGCVPILYNMCFVPFSQNYLGSYLSDDTEKTTNMFLSYFYHAYRYTDFGKRFIKKEAYEYYQVGYWDLIDGDKIPAGYLSELRIITWKDNPEKGVGGPCDLFVVEEAGLHPYLLTSLGFITPACKDGDFTTGTVLVYGAAGKDGQYEGLKKLHYAPRAYNAYSFPNKWEPESHYKESGLFIPNYSCRKPHIDEDGNPMQANAIIARDKSLKELEKKDHEKYLLDLSQYPNTPSEMFAVRGRKRFNQKLIAQQIAYLESQNAFGQAIELYEDINKGGIKELFVDEKIKSPIRKFPLEGDMDKEGCIEIFEFPDADPPPDLYIGGIDSYNQEDSYYSESLGSCFIYKKVSHLAKEGTHRLVVAECTQRPKSKYDFYMNCAMLAKYYNAVLMLENEDQEATPWFFNNNYEHLLADQPDIIRQIIPNSKSKRQKGIHAAEQLIIAAENKIARYINEDLGFYYDDLGNVTGRRYGVSRILSLGLLYELKDYVHDRNKNFDRVRAFGWTMLYEDETFQQVAGANMVQDSVSKFLSNTNRSASSTLRGKMRFKGDPYNQ